VFSYDQELIDTGTAKGRIEGKIETINNGLQKGQKLDFMLEITGFSLVEYEAYMKNNFRH